MQQLPDKMNRLPSQHSRDCGDADRVHHRDGRTFPQEVRGRSLRTAIPNDLRLEAVDVKVQPLGSPCLVVSKAYNRAIGCSSIYRFKPCSFGHTSIGF
jgi:hypothetical protein